MTNINWFTCLFSKLYFFFTKMTAQPTDTGEKVIFTWISKYRMKHEDSKKHLNEIFLNQVLLRITCVFIANQNRFINILCKKVKIKDKTWFNRT